MRGLRIAFLLLCLFPLLSAAQPTFADLSVLLAKGYFKSHVSEDASLEVCVAFLNRQGVSFSVFDLMDQSAKVTKEDFARVVGQSTLLFLGEAEVENGSIKRPEEMETWVDCCVLNDVDFQTLWKGFLLRMEDGHLPEVQAFFDNRHT